MGTVTSGSMESTLMTGDTILVNKLAYILKEPKRGDIVCFYSKESGKVMAKRIIGIENDIIAFVDGEVFINGELYIEEYIDENCESYSLNEYYQVPENCVFLLGDNRENSFDSRYWINPYISINTLYGKVIFNY